MSAEPRRILLDASPLDNGHATRGIGRYAAGVLRGLEQQDPHEITLLRQEATDSKLPAVTPRRPWPGCNVPWRQAMHLEFALSDLLSRTQARLFHLLDPLPIPAPRKGLKLSATVLDLIPLLVPEHRVKWRDEWGLARLHYHRIFLSRLRQADGIVAISHAVKEDIVQHLRIPAERIRVIHLGAEDAPLKAGAPTHEEERFLASCQEVPYFLFSGAAEPRKNLDRAITALAQSGLPHRFVIAGKAGISNMRRLEETARALGCQDRILFPGFVSDTVLARLYRNADALIFPSTAEGFGLPLLEAMREDCPVLTSRGHCLEEVAGDAAILVNPASVDDIRNGMCRIAGDPLLRENLKAAGRTRWQEFKWTRCASELRSFWADLL